MLLFLSQHTTDASVVNLVQLTTISSLSQWTSSCVCNTFSMMQSVARVRLQQVSLLVCVTSLPLSGFQLAARAQNPWNNVEHAGSHWPPPVSKQWMNSRQEKITDWTSTNWPQLTTSSLTPRQVYMLAVMCKWQNSTKTTVLVTSDLSPVVISKAQSSGSKVQRLKCRSYSVLPMPVTVFNSRLKTFLFSEAFSLFPLLINTLPGPSASEVTM